MAHHCVIKTASTFALYRVAGKQLQQLHNHQIGIVLVKIDRRRIDRATLVIRRMHFHR
jgi:hypothetical protein